MLFNRKRTGKEKYGRMMLILSDMVILHHKIYEKFIVLSRMVKAKAFM